MADEAPSNRDAKLSLEIPVEHHSDTDILRLPAGMIPSQDHVAVRREGGRLVIEAGTTRAAHFIKQLRLLGPVDERFPDIDDPLPEAVTL